MSGVNDAIAGKSEDLLVVSAISETVKQLSLVSTVDGLAESDVVESKNNGILLCDTCDNLSC